MSDALRIEADWERLERGAPEDRACFAALGLRYDGIWLTKAEDAFVNRLRDKVHVSAYRLAEWLAWNWWRLRWEPRTRAPDWPLAHRMTTIGGGYIWPNITVFSDGERVVLLAKPTQPRAEEPLRYIADLAAVVRASAFENTVDIFLEQVLGQLREEGLADTNLDRIWGDVRAERADPGAASRRKFEALLGFDPDEAEEAAIETLVADARILGEQAMNEVAADRTQGGVIVTASRLRETAAAHGFDAAPDQMVRLAVNVTLSPVGQVPAWRRGAEAARALRDQEMPGATRIENARLAEMVGVSAGAITDRTAGPEFSFALDDRVVLRSRWETGRRFALVRLLGDRIAADTGGRLFPATRAYTYRQKLQRAFAAEFLCPFDALEDMLSGDYSVEALEDAAADFGVSERTVRTLLVNHGRIDREDLEGEFETATVAWNTH